MSSAYFSYKENSCKHKGKKQMLYREVELMAQRGHCIILPEVITLVPRFVLENGFGESTQKIIIPLEIDLP